LHALQRSRQLGGTAAGAGGARRACRQGRLAVGRQSECRGRQSCIHSNTTSSIRERHKLGRNPTIPPTLTRSDCRLRRLLKLLHLLLQRAVALRRTSRLCLCRSSGGGGL
jgi:hypothetical protein